jgi:hypothetical protein
MFPSSPWGGMVHGSHSDGCDRARKGRPRAAAKACLDAPFSHQSLPGFGSRPSDPRDRQKRGLTWGYGLRG